MFPSFQDATMKQLLANIDNVTIIMIMMIILMQICIYLQNTTNSETTCTGSIRRAPDLLALIGSETCSIVSGHSSTLRVLELNPGDQVEKLEEIINILYRAVEKK